ncbi:MAG TPA: response regulator transcription factor [Gaiellaceae bacterium]|jgi:DNA-binding NarL/FixJ family response regulator
MRELREKSAVILDRHPLWLDAMDRLVVGLGVEVVGRATDGDEAVTLIEEYRPDVFIAGIDPANSDEVVYVRRASESHPGLKSIVVADNKEAEAISAAFAAGATVYCVKTAEQEDLASAIRQAFERSIYIATSGSRDFSLTASSGELQPAAHDLTRRELEILQLVAEGHSNSQLARMLWVTEQTVKFHLSNIYRKLDVANRTEASRWAQLHGLLPTRRDQDEHESSLATSAA